MKKVLVAGATGYLGGYIVKELKKRGYWVRVLLRKEGQKQQLSEADEFFVGQITQPKTLNGIMLDIDWVFTTVGITRQKDGLTYMDVDYQGNRNLLDLAEKAKVTQFQYVSVLHGDQLPKLKITQAKERFVQELKISSIQSSIIRPSGFFSDMVDFLKMAKKKKVYLFGDGSYRLNPISGKDLAIVCVDAMEQNKKEINVGGPNIYSQNEISQLALNANDTEGKIVHLPIWIRNWSLVILRTFTSAQFYGPFEFFLTAMTMDAATDTYGQDSLEDFFNLEAKKL